MIPLIRTKTDVHGNTEETPANAVPEKPNKAGYSLKDVSAAKLPRSRKTWRYALFVFLFLFIIGVASGGGHWYYIHKKKLQEAANLPPVPPGGYI
jgi:hypothetical protein